MSDNPTATSSPRPPRPDLAAEAVKRLCLAESIARIFSVTHPKGQAAVQGAFEAMTALLNECGPVALSLTEGRVLVGGQPVEDRNPAVSRFVTAFQQIHVDNLLFSPELTSEEFGEFFRVLVQGAKVINEQGGLAALLKDKGVTHIRPQQVTYVMVRDEEKVPPFRPPAGSAVSTLHTAHLAMAGRFSESGGTTVTAAG